MSLSSLEQGLERVRFSASSSRFLMPAGAGCLRFLGDADAETFALRLPLDQVPFTEWAIEILYR